MVNIMNLDQINDAPDILMEFLEYHSTVRGHSDKTVAGYYLDLKILFRFIKRRRHLVPAETPFNEIDISDVDIDFIKSIRIEELYRYQSFSPEMSGSNRSLSAASRCRRTSSVKSFYNYLTVKRHLLDFNICQELDMPKRPNLLPRYLEEAECERLLSVCDGPFALRDYCILMLFMSCGMRVSELVSLNAIFGEGWLLPAEIASYCRHGVNNVISLQPFGCIANHIVERGIENKIKKTYHDINLLSIDFDSGVSDVNIVNRLLLFLDNIRMPDQSSPCPPGHTPFCPPDQSSPCHSGQSYSYHPDQSSSCHPERSEGSVTPSSITETQRL